MIEVKFKNAIKPY